VRLSGEILKGLARAVAEGEKKQRRFRDAVVIRLARIETIVHMIHGGQIVEAGWRKPAYDRKIEAKARDAERFISQESDVVGLAMVKYIHGELESTERRKRRRIVRRMRSEP
jgi:hypothetical protein